MGLFKIDERHETLVVKCPAKMDSAAAHELLALLKAWIPNQPRVYVLDFIDVIEVGQVLYRPFSLTQQVLKRNGSLLFSMNLPPPIARQLKAAGLDAALSARRSLGEVLASVGGAIKRIELDPEFLKPFGLAIKNTLEIQANTPVEVGIPRLKRGDETLDIDIASVISLASKIYNGSIALCFPEKVFVSICSNMLGEKHEKLAPDIEDAAGELLNMIFGGAKTALNENRDFDIQRAIPAIVRGHELYVHHLGRGAAVVFPCKTDAGNFHLEVAVEPA